MKILAIVLLALPLSLQAQGDEWDVYLSRHEKGNASTLINMALKRIAPSRDFPFVLATGVTFRECTSDGFPTKSEFPNLYRVSDSVKAIIDHSTKNIMAATFTYQCQRLDYYYVADTTGLREKLSNMYSSRFISYTPYTNLKADQEWRLYLDFLYPNEEIQESMSNQKVILKLQEAGDKLDKPRKVDHWIYFPTEADRNCFVAYLVKHNFKVESTEKTDNANSSFSLHISRTDKVDLASMNKVTMDLKQEAKKCNGNYDGWETVVVK